jgi:hypothetical protein
MGVEGVGDWDRSTPPVERWYRRQPINLGWGEESKVAARIPPFSPPSLSSVWGWRPQFT